MSVFAPFSYIKNTVITTLAPATTTTLAPTTTTTIPALVATPKYYYDAGNSTSYPGTGTTWTNLGYSTSGTVNLTIYGDPVYSSTEGGGSFDFDGSNDNAQLANTQLNLTARTVLSWVRLDSLIGVDKGIAGVFQPGSNGEYIGYDSGSGWKLGSWGSGGNRNKVSNVKETSTSDWVMVTGVWQVSPDLCQLYKNDTLIASASLSINGYGSANIIIGGYGGSTGSPTGAINADIALSMWYDRALSSTEITQNYNHFKGRFGL
jgi:hypothetical protein